MFRNREAELITENLDFYFPAFFMGNHETLHLLFMVCCCCYTGSHMGIHGLYLPNAGSESMHYHAQLFL